MTTGIQQRSSALSLKPKLYFTFYVYVSCVIRTVRAPRGAATDSGPPGQHIHSGPPAFRGGGGGEVLYITEIAIAFPSQSFFPLLPN